MRLAPGAMAAAGRKLLTLGAGGLGGWAAWLLAIPLPWVLGSMLGVAVVTLLGAGAKQPIRIRRVAQLTIGTALGLGFTPVIVRQVAIRWPSARRPRWPCRRNGLAPTARRWPLPMRFASSWS